MKLNSFMIRLLSAFAVAGLVPAAAAPQISGSAATQMNPLGQWVVEHADWACVLNRDLSVPGSRRYFALSLEPLSSVAWLKIATDQGNVRSDSGDAVMFFDGERLPETLHYNIFKAGQYQIREYRLDPKRHDVALIKNGFRLWTKRHGDIEVRLTGLKAAWGAMRQCMSGLYKELGIDESEIARMAVKPEGRTLDSVNFKPLRPGGSLEFVTLYWVTAEGRVDDCRLLKPSGQPAFDRSFCNQLKSKARFRPARDAAGQPIRMPRFENIQLRRSKISSTTPSQIRVRR